MSIDNEDQVEFCVEFSVRNKVTYVVTANSEDEAIEKASQMAECDYDNFDYYDSWEK